MSAVATIITSGRYDLRDPNSIQYADAELLIYLNRGLVQLNLALVSLKSDWTHETDESTDLLAAANSVVAPTDLISVRSLWFGSDQVIPKAIDYIYYKRKYVTATGQPDYYAEEGLNIIFERTADADYTNLVIHYDKTITALTLTGNMPFNGQFDEALRQVMVMIAKATIEHEIMTEAELYNYFLRAAMNGIIARNHKKSRYKTDF